MGKELILERFQEQKKQLLEDLNEIDSELKKLAENKRFLHGRVRILKTKKSEMAKNVLAKYEKSFCEAEENYNVVCLKRKEIDDELKEIEEKINKCQDNPNPFIEEKVPYIAKFFWEYVGKNFEELGQRVQVAYAIHEVLSYYKLGRFDGYDIPTGNVGIIDVETKEVIAYTNDFPYSQKLYEPNYSPYTGETSARNTEWYNTFLYKFTVSLYEALEKTNPYKDTFVLVFDKMTFILELV